MPTDPVWIAIARRYIGVAETPGKATTPTIRRWLIELNAWWTDDSVPWCGTFAAAVMRQAGCELPRHWYRARDWLGWGIRLSEPAHGCVVVYERGPSSGHVGFVMGWDRNGHLMTLGGNQSDKVSIAPFDRHRVLGYRWPGEYASVWPQPLATLSSTGPTSRDEA